MTHDVVFLFDVDNTLLDNDSVERDLRAHLETAFGVEQSQGYWQIFEALRHELGYADYLGALQRYRLQYPHHPRLLGLSSFLIDYPFRDRLYPGALEVIRHLSQFGPCVVLSDGDVVFQPHKVERSGIGAAVDGRVLIYVHKEQELDDVAQRFPAAHYVLVDDKLRILSAVKGIWESRVTTVFPRQGHYAFDLKVTAMYPSADLNVERIADLLALEPGLLLGNTGSSPDRSEAQQLEAALGRFVAALRARDWTAFQSCFSPQASVFQDGETAATPRSVFEAAPPGPLEPQNLRFEQSNDLAVTSFQLESAQHSPSGRTLVWRRGESGWKIVHLHAAGTSRSPMSNPTQALHDLGQSLWLDNITRGLLNSGTLERYIRDLAVTGLTSNPSIFNAAIKGSGDYDADIRARTGAGMSGDGLFFELALDDLTRAADLFKPVFDATNGVDGYVSLEVSPLLAYDTAQTIHQAKELFARAGRQNLFIKIPGTPEGLPAIEEAIFSGVPINVTLLFSREQYLAAAEAYLRGLERRVEAGLSPRVASVASVFVSRWDRAVTDKVPEAMHNTLGIAVMRQTYRAYCDLLESQRWQKLAAQGAMPQRALWASTGTKDPKAADTLYIDNLAAPNTVNTMPEATLLAFADHGKLGGTMPRDGGDAEAVLAGFAAAGVDVAALAEQLQREGAEAFVTSWHELLAQISAKSGALETASS